MKKLCVLMLVLILILSVACTRAEETETVSVGMAAVRPENYLELVNDPYAVRMEMPEGFVPPEAGEGGSVMVTYLPGAAMDLSTGIITMNYTHGWESTHKLVLQLIISDVEGNEHLLAQSGILEPGSRLERMDIMEAIPVGTYECSYGLFFFTGDSNYAALATRVAVTLTVTDGAAE